MSCLKSNNTKQTSLDTNKALDMVHWRQGMHIGGLPLGSPMLLGFFYTTMEDNTYAMLPWGNWISLNGPIFTQV